MPGTVSASSTVVVGKDQVSSDLGGEAAILNLQNETYYGLNPVGARVWELIQQPRAVHEISQVLVAEYDVDPERCGREVVVLLQQLVDEGLAEVLDATPA